MDVAKNALDSANAAATYTLKDLVAAYSADNEPCSDVDPAALASYTFVAGDEVRNFEKLVRFCEECPSVKKTEVVQVVYPLLVHVYICLFAMGHVDQAKSLDGRFFRFCDSSQQTKLSELFGYASVNELLASPLVTKFKNKKYLLKMSEGGFQLLMQFLQVLGTPFLLSLIQKYLGIEVCAGASLDRPEVKKLPGVSFVKPLSSRVEGNRQLGKRRHLLHSPVMATYQSPSVPSSAYTAARQERNKEFRKRLAGLEAMDPRPPSVAVCCVQQERDIGLCCATMNTRSMQCACGFADSSIHIWSHLPSSSGQPCHGTTVTPPSCDRQQLVGHSGPIYGASFSADGSFLLSSSGDCSVKLWDVQQRACAMSYEGHSHPVWDVSFGAKGINFASAGMDQTVRLWVTDRAFPMRMFVGHNSGVNVVEFHPNGEYIGSGSQDTTCRLWDAASGQCVRVLSGSKTLITAVAFSPDGQTLVGGGADGHVTVWDLGMGHILCRYPPPPLLTLDDSRDQEDLPVGAVSGLSFSQDGALLAISLNNHLRAYDTRRFAPTFGDRDCVFSLQLSPDVCSSVVYHQFTHRNCLAVVTKLDQASLMPSSMNLLA